MAKIHGRGLADGWEKKQKTNRKKTQQTNSQTKKQSLKANTAVASL